MYIVLDVGPSGDPVAAILDDTLTVRSRIEARWSELPGWIAEQEADHPRWVWSDTRSWHPRLLAAGVRVERCHDLRMVRRILRRSPLTVSSVIARAPRDAWDDRASAAPAQDDGLFSWNDSDAVSDAPDALAEFLRQREAVSGSGDPSRLELLLAADSVGALIAVELEVAGLPWSAERHEAILEERLGPRPATGMRPARMEEKLAELRLALGVADVNPESQPSLLRALQHAGMPVRSTSKWELRGINHPAIAPLLAYKSLQRLHAANGWAWLDEWVRDGRFRSVYVPAGVVTGRWASDGGGALQLPQAVRGAVVADPGWSFVVADAAQLEPRILAAMSGDAAMARAGRAHDLYQGMVEAGAVETREQAKYGMLGAIYGGTTGESGRMRPRIATAFPRAMAYVEQAARTGEQGGQVSTWLGRGSPVRGNLPDASDETMSDEERHQLRGDSAAWGRFTRNFVVQGTAAEWAMCWMGALRRRLWELGGGDEAAATLSERPQLVFFLHDEVIVHTPIALAEPVAEAVRAAAVDAGRMLFGSAPVDFALDVAIVDCYADAT